MVTIKIEWARDHHGRSLGFAQLSVEDDFGNVSVRQLDDTDDMIIELDMSTEDGTPAQSKIEQATTE